MRSLEHHISKKRREYGDKFNDQMLDMRFAPYFESQQRVHVNIDGDEESGYVGITTGWVPVFILLKTSRSSGGATVLDERAKIVDKKFKITINRPE